LQANIIRGRVVDAETGEPLEGAQVPVPKGICSVRVTQKTSIYLRHQTPKCVDWGLILMNYQIAYLKSHYRNEWTELQILKNIFTRR